MSLITTASCRVRQALLRAKRRGAKSVRPSVEEGAGSVFSVAQVLRSSRLHKPMVVVGSGADSGSERVIHALEESAFDFALWPQLPEEPTAEEGENLRLQWIREQCDCFIVVGDGAAIDITKAAAARAACRGKTIMNLVGRDKVRRKLPPVVAIPTVAGSGAETLARAEFSDGRGNRFAIQDPNIAPAFAILDPELIADAPRPALAEAAVSGLCLAVEAYLSGFGDDMARAAAADAVRGYLEAVEPCWNSGGTAVQRSILLTASRDAGEAASRAGFGYAAALSRSAAKVGGVSFGAACAAILPAVLEKYGNHAVGRLAALAELSGAAERDTSHPEKAAALIRRIRQLAFRIGLPDALEGLSRDGVNEVADLAAVEANPWYACPAVWPAADLAAVLRKAGAHVEK